MKKQAVKIAEELTNLISKGYSIIYLDEVMFTNKTVLKTEYARKNENIQVDYKDFNT